MEDRLKQLKSQYSFDKKEFGKVLLIASASLFVVSVHSALVFDQAESEMRKVNNQFTEAKAIMDSPSFNNSLQALNSLKTTDIGRHFTKVAKAFNKVKGSLNHMEQVEKDMSRSAELYRWLVLVSMAGMVAGGSLIYV